MVIPLAKQLQKIFDPHVHFFDLSKGQYTWLQAQNEPFWPDKHIVAKNILPSQLDVNNLFDLIGGVHIEAGFDNDTPHNELQWLEQDVYPITPKLIFKSIAYADIKIPNLVFTEEIRKLSFYTTFVGIRYIFRENEFSIAEFKNVLQNLKFLEKAGFMLEIQVDICDDLLARSLLSLFSQVPQLTIVINHAGLPPFSTNLFGNESSASNRKVNQQLSYEMGKWQRNLASFAKIRKCFIKCSGFEMQSRDYTKQQVIEVISLVHALYGNERLMLASNFPLTLFSTSYAAYWHLLHICAKEANVDCERVMHLNAKRLYVGSQ